MKSNRKYLKAFSRWGDDMKMSFESSHNNPTAKRIAKGLKTKVRKAIDKRYFDNSGNPL